MSNKNLKGSICDGTKSFKQRAKAKDEFVKRYAKVWWICLWGLVSVYSLIMGIVYAAKYLNAPDEHCYYDASLNTPLPISGGNLKAVDQADKLYLILKLGMILHACFLFNLLYASMNVTTFLCFPSSSSRWFAC